MKSKKSAPSKTPTPIKKKDSPVFDRGAFQKKYSLISLSTFAIVFVLFLFGVFKNISYPLFWADESMTVVGAERVAEFGFPKVHDGKNVFYDLRHSDPELGIDKKSDAYVGGTSWLQYYYGVIGVKMASGKDDIYAKTGTIRSSFAIIGLLGLLFLAFAISTLFSSPFEKYLFATIFFLFELFSVSLLLLIREARYYSLTIFLVCTTAGLYILSRGAGKIRPWIGAALLAVSLWLSFFAFSSVYFILFAAIAVAEIIIYVWNAMKKETNAFRSALPYLCALAISLAGIYPFLSYFRTFEISSAMAEYNGYSSTMYWDNVATVYKYFSKFEALWLFIILKVVMLLNVKKALEKSRALTFASLTTFAIAVIFAFAIGKIPNFIYTRYIIPMQPLLVAGFVCDVFILFRLFSSPETPFTFKNVMLIGIPMMFFLYTINKNSKDISGHLTEMTQQYKGPLDYTIPFIKEKYKNTDTLVIAANYEESSYIYYLHSKVVMGFIGNNLGKDSLANPDIIIYRKPWGNFIPIFEKFLGQAQYETKFFPTFDNAVNNIPELNFQPLFNHHYKEKTAEVTDREATQIFYRK